MKITYNEIIKNIDEKKYSPVYLLHGDEPFFIDFIANKLLDNVIPDDFKGFNEQIFYGKDSNIFQVILSCKQYPMIGDKQLIVLKEGQDIDIKKEESITLLEKYIDTPQISTILVICFKYKKPPAKLLKHFETSKNAVSFDAKKVYENQIPQWINQRVIDNNYSINNKAISMLIEFVGNDLEKIDNELSKLYLNIAKKSTINEKHIEKYIGLSKDYNIFELISALSLKDEFKTYQIVMHFSKNPNENPLLKTLPMLFSHFNKILLAHSIPNKTEQAITEKCKLNYFTKSEFFIAMRNYSVQKTLNVISNIRESNAQALGINNTNTSQGDILRDLVYKILN